VPLDPEFWRLAARFVAFIGEETGLGVIVCDGKAVIRQASVAARVGKTHPPSVRILGDEADETQVTAEEAARHPNVREGYVCPIEVGGARVGTFGISGPLPVARPMARVAAAVLASWLKEAEHEHALADTAARVVATSQELSGSLGSEGALAKAATARREAASRLAAERLAALEAAALGSPGLSALAREAAAAVRELDEAGRQAGGEAARLVDTLRDAAGLLEGLRQALADRALRPRPDR
jgi:hypothetical protein